MNDSELILFLIEGNQENKEDVSECIYYPESRKISTFRIINTFTYI